MASRRARRERAQAAAAQRTTTAARVDTARAEIAHRSLLAAAEPYRGELPTFYGVALDLGVVPDPAPVPAEALTDQTRLLPVVKPGSLLGLMDTLSEEKPMTTTREPWRCGKCKRLETEFEEYEELGWYVSACQHVLDGETHDDEGEALTTFDQRNRRHWCGDDDCEVVDMCANCWSNL